MRDDEKYVNVSDVKRKMQYIFKAYRVVESMKKMYFGIFDKVPVYELKPHDIAGDIHGHWQAKDTVGGYRYYCSICGEKIIYDRNGEEVFGDYCTHCRAILDEPVNEECGKVQRSDYLKLSPKKENNK